MLKDRLSPLQKNDDRPLVNDGFKLPQIVFKWKHQLSDGRTVHACMTMLSVEQAPFGKNLLCKYRFELNSTISDALIANLGFDAERLRSMWIVPQKIALSRSETVKEFASATLEKQQRELFDKYKKWALSHDFHHHIMQQLKIAVKKGPGSPFAEY